MLKYRCKFVMAAIISCATNLTFAAGLTSFVGVGLGNTYANIDSPSGQMTTSSTGFHFVAGSQINPMFALEAEYFDLGQLPITNAYVAAKGMGVSGLLTLPITGMLSIYGRAGFARLETTVTLGAGVTPTTPLSDTVVGLSYGYGIQADVAPNASICLSWDRYKSSALAGPFTNRIDMNSSALLVFRF
jgi:opacity protein-like surface antigen